MCRTQCVLALATLYVGLVHSWDIAVSVGDQLEFYTDGTKTDTVHLEFRNLAAITYDEVHNMILFVDKQRDNDALCGYNLSSKNTRCFFNGSNIHDLAFDPATDLLFFTDKKYKTINCISLKKRDTEGYVPYRKFLITFADRTPSDIEVDSCNGLIYWTNTEQSRRGYYMERARLDGSERYTVDRIIPVNSFAIDLQTQNNYFFTGLNHNLLNKVDLRGKNIMNQKKMIFYNKPRSAQELTVSKDYLYWTQSSASDKTVWQMLKNASISAKPKMMCRFHTGHTLGIAANYKIKDQVQGLQECEALARLIPILETEQTTEQDWSTSTEQTSGSTAKLDWLTESTLTTEVGSTTELDWFTGSTETETEQTSGSTADLDWSTGSTENSELGSTTELDWLTGSTETETEQTSGSTVELDWSTGSTENSELGSTADLDWVTESTGTEIEQTSSSTADLSWVTVTKQTSVQDSTTELYEGSKLYETTEAEQTSELYEAPESKHKIVLLNEKGELDWTTETEHTSETEFGTEYIGNGGYSGKTHGVHACHGYCLNNGNCSLNKNSEPVCHCKGDYVGDRCEVSGCLNYCFQGNCSLNDEGHPKCRCNAGYSGARCEVYACHSYCLNSGTCSLNKKDKPVCRCVGNHEGTRCEAVKNNTFSYSPQTYFTKRNLTVADLVSNWHKPGVKVSVIVEV